MVRLNETLGKTRVEFREQLASSEANLRGEISSQSDATRAVVHEVASTETSVNGRPALSGELGRDVAESLKKLSAEIKQTNKAVATLSRKFERFDDRMTVQVKDQDQRLKKVETRRPPQVVDLCGFFHRGARRCYYFFACRSVVT